MPSKAIIKSNSAEAGPRFLVLPKSLRAIRVFPSKPRRYPPQGSLPAPTCTTSFVTPCNVRLPFNEAGVIENKHGERLKVSVDGSLYANNGNLICDALINGMGIARLPTFIVGDAVREGKAKTILDDWRPEPQDISLLYYSSNS